VRPGRAAPSLASVGLGLERDLAQRLRYCNTCSSISRAYGACGDKDKSRVARTEEGLTTRPSPTWPRGGHQHCLLWLIA
jgi:hypothetical protein